MNYCGIVIIRGGSMFVAFMDSPRQDFTSPQTFNIYENYHELATNEITSPQNRKILVTNEHWLPRIPQYI